MAYSPSKRPRISTSSSSSTTSLASPNPSDRTLSRRNSWSRSPANETPSPQTDSLEQTFRAEDTSRPFKYEFPSQTSLGFQETSSLDDDETFLTPNGTESPKKRKYSAGNNRTTLGSVSISLRRLSDRIVNLGIDDRHHKLDDSDTRTPLEYSNPDSFPPPAQSFLRGTTLGIFGPSSTFRKAAYRALMYQYTEPLVLVLILLNAIVLIIQSARAVFLGFTPDRHTYFQTWEDYVIFVLFILYTLEAFARICVNGFILDPEVPISTLSFYGMVRQARESDTLGGQHFHAMVRQIVKPFSLPKAQLEVNEKLSEIKTSESRRSFSYLEQPLPFVAAIQKQRSLIKRGVPYLRHSWSRIDMIAIGAFWITFILSSTGVEREVGVDAGSAFLIRHVGLFRALSVLRCARFLAITNGTTTIMQSLKLARPLLAQVAYFVLFAMILFSIIGVQSFKGSFRRQCVLLPFDGTSEISLGQQCGGFIDSTTLQAVGFLHNDNTSSGRYVKGFVCPLGQICQEQASNPFNNLEAYDNFPLAVLQIVVVASANTWSPTMYDMIDAEFFISCIFFIICILVLNFWLINLFVAVITNSFQAIRAQTKKSAFGATESKKLTKDDNEEWSSQNIRSSRTLVRELYRSTRFIWPLLAIVSLGLAASKTSNTSSEKLAVLNKVELGITIAFDFEILWRLITYLPDWRGFIHSPRNWVDLTLAIINSVIQIPPIHSSDAYPWLTVFQLARWYRVILEVPRMRSLILTVFGNSSGLVNMTLFLLITNGLAALAAVQLLRGDLDDSSNMNFSQIWIAFLGMYQILSSENWTTVLYGAATVEQPTFMMWVVAIFLSGWLLFGNFILIQLFIAVINENFQIAEETKREQQVAEHLASRDVTVGRFAWISRLNPYKYTKSKPKALIVESLPSNLTLPLRKAVIQDRFAQNREESLAANSDPRSASDKVGKGTRAIDVLHRLFQGDTQTEEVPMATFTSTMRSDSAGLQIDDVYNLPDGLISFQPDLGFSEEVRDDLEERKAQKADFIIAHPSYDKSFWVFSQKNFLRQICQSLVEPSNGERIFGRPPSRTAHSVFQLFIFLTIVGGIVVTSIATPLYRRNFYNTHGPIRNSWFVIVDGILTLVLILEVIIKVIADGFIFTPNAYLLSIWNLVDLVVVMGLTINSTTTLIFLGGLSRFTRALKALRALRLITLFDKMRSTFYSLLILGFVRILDAGILAALYMIPYAVWGLNIFAGLSFACNDTSVDGKNACRNEYLANASPLPNDYTYLAPRIWENPITSTRWSFDTFADSILILFEIVSLEGWIDVMSAAIDITGKDEQPQINAAQWNAIFFLIYNLLGAVVILTLFVSIIIGNFSSRSGLALLTESQREWVDLLKLIKRQRPSKRPKVKPPRGFRAWAFDRATSKHGYWMTSLTFIYVFHIILLMTQTFSNQFFSDTFRDICFLILSIIYVIDIAIKLIGLGWVSFRANGWNIFDVIVVAGSMATTIAILSGSTGFIIQQLQKLFLVSIAFKLVQRNNSLNQLFKTSISSLPVILSLLLLWFAVFIFFGILYVEIFGLTRWESAETHNENYTSLGRALVMLAFMSTGEGWNQYMHDFAVAYPRCTNSSPSDSDSDCGSPGWAYLLFITWNILSMYIFVNLFTGVVVENFSYVFQLAGGAKSVDREQMRAFKKVWAEFADQQTGRLKREKLVPFMGRLSGVFEIRVYSSNYQVNKVLTSARVSEETQSTDTSPLAPEIDLRKLNQVLNTMDIEDIRRRRILYARIYHEACLTYERKDGISFTEMLLLLAHNKLITDKDALSVKELLIRQETTRAVLDAVNVDKVQSLLKVIHHRRRFLRIMEEKRRLQRNNVPKIIVELDSVDAPSSDTILSLSAVDSGTSLNNLSDRELGRQSSEYSREDFSSPRHSMALENPQNLLMSLSNSPWGELFTEHVEDE